MEICPIVDAARHLLGNLGYFRKIALKCALGHQNDLETLNREYLPYLVKFHKMCLILQNACKQCPDID